MVLDIYPLSSYYFTSKPAVSFKDETLADRARRLKSNYDAHGIRTCVEAVILHPHLLLLQAKNCVYKLPGGRLRPGESDVDGLKRKLSSKLSLMKITTKPNGSSLVVGSFLVPTLGRDTGWHPVYRFDS
ncbi:hypothetical protein OSB04_015325 [Centaurea solstitialis]|uniref:Nudix hydrolase domain-containing protein n=1 Tax=Centaurea solstitialis TaxID=347529 RepID=A0AA38SYT4_9ASTR|nr:hypothetical protein OSB04_015325 [Centaurea solstitialis]